MRFFDLLVNTLHMRHSWSKLIFCWTTVGPPTNSSRPHAPPRSTGATCFDPDPGKDEEEIRPRGSLNFTRQISRQVSTL